ncbi:50S ribosomal protein L23 [bacterium]|nr:MAG: 50S ribosomal protein L23 [bacterium]
MKDPYKIIVSPIITEKATVLREAENKYSFYVHPEASKNDIRRSVEKIFNVEVVNIWTHILPGKPRIRGRYRGRTPAKKKAIVQIREGQTIPFFEGLI